MTWNPLSSVIKAVSSYVSHQQSQKAQEVEAQAKLQLAKLSGDKEVTLTDQQWEAIVATKQDASWKDEYITILITSPIALILIGALVAVYSQTVDGIADTRLLDSVSLALTKLKDVGVEMGYLMNATVLAALGLKIWRRK